VFRIKDLAISVVPKASDIPELQKCLLGTHICIRPTIICRPLSLCHYLTCGFVSPCRFHTITACWQYISCQLATNNCGFVSPICPLNSVVCEFATRPQCPGPSIYEGDPATLVINPQVLVINEVADIKALREELDQVQRSLAEFEQKGLDVETQTPEELADLETKLREALSEIEARRKQGGKK
jgi:hypothetical protein